MLALGAAYAYSLMQRPADLLIIQSLSASTPPVRWAAHWALQLRSDCPVEDFTPTTPIGLLVAGWSDAVAPDTPEDLLTVLINQGCDIDSQSKSGLSPLHSAVLFNNPDAVRTLLRHGADLNALTNIESTRDASTLQLSVSDFADYLDQTGNEERTAVKLALREAQSL